MRKTILLLVVAVLASSAGAGELVVAKDTRQYMPVIQTREGTGECVNANCMAEEKAPVGGEYILRVGDVCRSESYELDKKSSFIFAGHLVPSIRTEARTYRCDAQGNTI
jgi:hypothetical protein